MSLSYRSKLFETSACKLFKLLSICIHCLIFLLPEKSHDNVDLGTEQLDNKTVSLVFLLDDHHPLFTNCHPLFDVWNRMKLNLLLCMHFNLSLFHVSRHDHLLSYMYMYLAYILSYINKLDLLFTYHHWNTKNNNVGFNFVSA